MKKYTYGLVRQDKKGDKIFIWVEDISWKKMITIFFESALKGLKEEKSG